MSRIQILSPEIANLIAAGEVVERPASVVKELVENALDAEAHDILVELEEGGKGRIVVRDDGVGMTREEVLLSLERHATSKVRYREDLERIATFGFRGEALPSIAVAGHFSLTSRARHGADAAVRVSISPPGTPTVVTEVGAPAGTCVEVRQLFADLPARRKFLKATRTELAHIHETLTRLALGAPERRFRLVHGGRTLMACHATTGLSERIAELFGATQRDQLLPLETEGPVRLRGYCGHPSLARSSGQHGYLFVNGRAVRDRLLQHAINEGYRTYLPRGAQPFVILFLALAADEVDVNVHPTKSEVRFLHAGAIHDLVRTAIQKALGTGNTLRHAITPEPRDFSLSREIPLAQESQGGGDPLGGPLALRESVVLPLPVSDAGWQQHLLPAMGPDDAPHPAGLRPIGQLAATYLLCATEEGGLLVIDQHAADERIGFETLKAAYAVQNIATQYLLDPVIVDLSPLDVAAIVEHQEILARVGVQVEPFGEGSVVVKALPALLAQADGRRLLSAIAAQLREWGRSNAVEGEVDHLFATMACHRQIRAGEHLRPAQIAGLVGQLTRGVSKDRCPHGRPTWTYFSPDVIKGWFHRPT
ncbi:MAG: DNA mismatch repair endonuclease MutL [Deltaproteobacteria bacterium]|nr:DNA mismatch repair endonuclease MutL [Deltaproteobacteria bacterium]